MRTRLLFVALLVLVALMARPIMADCTIPGTDCPACSETNGVPQAQMFLKVNSANESLVGTFFYENISDEANPRPLLVDAPVIVEMYNNTVDKTYRIYTDANGKAVFDFSAYAGACMNFKVMYCPFACTTGPSKSDCGFQNCLNYSGIPCSPGTCLASCTAGSVLDAPNIQAPQTPQCYILLPTMDTASYCPPPPPISSVPAICFPLLLIFAVLGGGLFLSGKNPFGGFDFTTPRTGKHIRYEAKGRGLGVSAPNVVTQKIHETGNKLATAGAKKLAGGAASLMAGGGKKGAAASASVAGHIEMKQAGGQRGGGMVTMAGGRTMATGSPAERFGGFGKVLGLVGYGIKGTVQAISGNTTGAKATFMKSSMISQSVGGIKSMVNTNRAVNKAMANAASANPIVYTPVAWAMLISTLKNAQDVNDGKKTQAGLGSIVSQLMNVKKGKAGAKTTIDNSKTVTVKENPADPNSKNVNKVVYEMTVGGKKVVATLDEASLRLGKFNGTVTVGNKTVNIEEGKVVSGWNELGGKDRNAVTDRVSISEVRQLVDGDKTAKKELEKTGTTTVTLGSGETIKVSVAADKEGKFSASAISDEKGTKGSFTITTSDERVTFVKDGKPTTPIGERLDMTEITGKLRSEGAMSDIAESGKTTIKLESGEKVTVIAADVASLDSGKFSIKTDDDKIVVVDTSKKDPNTGKPDPIVSVGTSITGASDLAATGKELGMPAITATLTAAVTMESRFSSNEYGGAVTVVTNPLGSPDDYTVIRPRDNDDLKGVAFEVVDGKVKTITDNSTGESLKADSTTGIKVGSGAPGYIPDKVAALGASVVQVQMAGQDLANDTMRLEKSLHDIRVTDSVSSANGGAPEEVRDYLSEHPEVHATIIQQAHEDAIETMARKDYPEKADEFRAANQQFEKDRQTMGSEAAYDKDLKPVTEKPFEEFAARSVREETSSQGARYAELVNKPEISEGLSYDEIAKMKADTKPYGAAMAAAAATELQSGARSDTEVRIHEIGVYAQAEAKNTGPTEPQKGVDMLNSAIASLQKEEQERKPPEAAEATARQAVVPVRTGGGGSEPPSKPETPAVSEPVKPEAPEETKRAKREETVTPSEPVKVEKPEEREAEETTKPRKRGGKKES